MKIQFYKVKCTLCGESFNGTEGTCTKWLGDHVEHNCLMAKLMTQWERDGVLYEILKILRQEAISRALKKLIQKYGKAEVIEAFKTEKYETKG